MAKVIYKPPQVEERMRIEVWKDEGSSLREVTRKLTRERRIRAPWLPPRSCMATAKLALGMPRGLLHEHQWSPQEIAAAPRCALPYDPHHHASHESIYNAVYAHQCGELRHEPTARPRRERGIR